MLIVKIKGGLGNQLFQYGFGRFLSNMCSEELLLDNMTLGSVGDTKRQYKLDNFNIKANIATREQVEIVKYQHGTLSKIWQIFQAKLFRKYYIGYHPELIKSKKTYYEGYFQSHRYLEPIRSELLDDLQLRRELSQEAEAILPLILASNSVSIHVRRGDYVNNTNRQYQTFGIEYYRNAISVIKQKISNPSFFLFTDDVEWCKKNISTLVNNIKFVSGDGLPDYEELVLMSKCSHNIIANSSFSFWGAWLNQNNDKIVIAPKIWSSRYKREFEDLLPNSWLKI